MQNFAWVIFDRGNSVFKGVPTIATCTKLSPVHLKLLMGLNVC